jgi:hypothetical protein
MRRLGLLALGVVAACSGAASDHERLGDEAYREQKWSRAVSEYQAAQRSGAKGRVWAKAGSAALHAGDLAAAIEAYRELAREEPGRAVEAAIGLERVARAAERGGGQLGTIARTVLALRAVAPERPLGRLVLPMGSAELEPAEVLGLLPTALATTPTARGVDSLLLRYADAQRATVACEGATGGYRAVLRRTTDARIKTAARAGLTECAVLLGQDALTARQASAAEKWFDLVLGFESDGPLGWRAQVGLGDARLMQGDALGAAVAWQGVLSAAGLPDSLRESVTAKLNSLGAASTEPPAGGDA